MNRNVQCKACPWKRSVVPERDIPGGYDAEKHEALRCTIAEPGAIGALLPGELRAMACHESPVGAEYPCVGWVLNQLGPGNNLALRLLARDGRFKDFRTVGPQWEHFEQTLPRGSK
jgi:hypothetical protein